MACLKRRVQPRLEHFVGWYQLEAEVILALEIERGYVPSPPWWSESEKPSDVWTLSRPSLWSIGFRLRWDAASPLRILVVAEWPVGIVVYPVLEAHDIHHLWYYFHRLLHALRTALLQEI